MTIERITLEWRFVQVGLDIVGHLALVARESGQSDGQGYVISGNPSEYGNEDPQNGIYGYLQANLGNGAGSALSDSVDEYPTGTTEADRHAENISSALLSAGGGRTLDQIWSDMCTLADQIDTQQFRYDPSKVAPPTGITANSNSLVNSVLSLIGIEASDYYGGTLPFLGFPGDGSILSGAGDDYMRGYDGNDTFLNAGGGNDIFHGGDGTSLVRSDGSDGHDVVWYDGFDRVSINTAGDLSSWQAVQEMGVSTYVDTLYSIEWFGSSNFLLEHSVNLENETEGKAFEDGNPSEFISSDSDFSDVTTVVKVEIDGVDAIFANFGTFTGTDYGDSFSLNEMIGRAFDGGDGVDTVDYSAVENAMYINMNPDHQIAYAMSAPGVTDSLLNIEHVIGAWDYSNIFRGGLGDIVPYEPVRDHVLTYEGGDEADLYVFDVAIDYVQSKIVDTGVIRIVDHGSNGVDIVRIENMEADFLVQIDRETYDNEQHTQFFIWGEPFIALDLLIEENGIETLELGSYAIGWANLQLWMEFRPDFADWGWEVSTLYNAVHNGPISNGVDYGNGVTPDVDGSGNIAGMTTSAAIGGQWTDGTVAVEQQHGWVLTEQNTAGGYSSFDASTYVKEISFASGITVEDLRFVASNSPSGDADLTIYVDSLSYSLTISDFEAGRAINGIGFYDMDLHGDVQSAGAVAMESSSAGQYTVQYEDGTAYTPNSMSITYYLETLLFSDSTSLDLQNAPLTFTGTSSNDNLYGLDTRDDVLLGLEGNDNLWGYGGADTFAFMLEDVGNGIDTLRDFDMTEDDVIDLRDVLDGGYDPVTDALADFVEFTNAGSHAALSVDLDGAGTTYGWTQIATVYDHNNLDADVLATNGYLLAA